MAHRRPVTALQLNRLAVPEKVDAGGWCHPCDMFGESLRRQINQLGTLTKPDGPPSTPVHGDGTIWLSATNHVSSLLGVEMTLIKRRSPASDRHQGDVDIRHLVKGKARPCVSRIPAPVSAVNEIAECGSAMRTPRESPPVVVSGQDAYLHAAKLHQVTWLSLPELHTAGDDWPEQAARTCWCDENGGRRDQSERRQVGVVGVEVGNQHEVRPRRVHGRNRTPNAPEMAQPSGQDGIEQDSCIAVPPGARAVPPPRECAGHGARCSLL
jgi:hypothetical protein